MSNHPMHGLPDPLPVEPLQVAEQWLRQARDERIVPNPNAMALATVSAGGHPAARIVLCKDIVLPDGFLVFYTNYESRKGTELGAHPRAAALFHWDAFERQVRVEGVVVKSPPAESDHYFRTRPWQSRVGAWASQQSRPIGSRTQLIEQLRSAGRRFGTPPVGPDARPSDDDASPHEQDATVEVPRPPHWGGFRLWAESVELWVGAEYRIHDRARWTRSLVPTGDGQAFQASAWHVQRLQP